MPRKTPPKTHQNWQLPAFSTYRGALGLALLVLIVYGNSLSAGFVTDDRMQLVRNPWVRSIRWLPQLLTSGSWGFIGSAGNYYRPTQLLAYLAVYLVRGYDAFSFHLLMVFLHLTTTLLVYLLVRRLTAESPALAAGALFAVHPIHTEVVDWIAAFPDAFSTLIVVLAVWLFVRQNGSPRGIQIAGHCGLYLLAVFSKEPGAMLLPLYLGFEWICLRRTINDLRRNTVLYAVMLAAAVFYLAARYHALGGLSPVARVLNKVEFTLSVVTLAAQYLGKLIAPTDLNYFHVFEPTRTLQPGVVLSLTVILALTAAFLVLRRRAFLQPGIPRTAVVSYGLWWIAITLAPALNLTHVGFNAFAERYLYLPSVGFVWIAAISWEWLAKLNPAVARTAGALVLVIFAWATIARNEDWHDDLRLMLVTARQSPESATVHDNLANDYAEIGKLDEALAEEKTATRLDPGAWGYHLNLGNLLISRDPRAAVEECEQALKSVPDDSDAYFCVGNAWKAGGDSRQAAVAYERTLAIAPVYYSAMLALQRLYWESGRVADAIDLLQRAAKARPSEPEPLIRLAVLYNDGGRYAEAAQAAQQGLALSPDPDLAYFAHYVLGTYYQRTGSLVEAANEFGKAYQAHPDRREARDAYQSLLAQLKAK